MLKTLNAVNTLLGTLLGLVVVGLLAVAGWLGYTSYYAGRNALDEAKGRLAAQESAIAGLSKDVQDKQRAIERLGGQLSERQAEITQLGAELSERQAEIARLNDDLKVKQQQIDKLDMALRLLKVDHRVAQLDVLGQKGSAADGDLETTVRFVEVDKDGKPLEKPRVFEIKGDVAYVESWVVKFTDDYVEKGDPLRSTSLCLFRRIFGEAQQPAQGYPLDPVGARPAAYQDGGKMSDMERKIWEQFWQYASDPALAEKMGVRAAHGEAPFVKLVPGMRYKVLLRSSGGLTLVPEVLPPEAAGKGGEPL